MSEVTRLDPFGYDGLSAFMTEDSHGDYVRYEDYDKQAQEIERLREDRDSQQRVCIAAMTELSQLKSRQSGVVLPEQWSKSFQDCWPVEEDDRDGDWAVGAVMRDGDEIYCPVITVEAAQYDAPGESEKIARTLVALLNPAEQLNKAQGEVPDECPHIIVFDDNDRPDEVFSGCGARPAAMRRWEQISQSWNAHLFVRVESNSRDNNLPNATITAPPAIPAVSEMELDKYGLGYPLHKEQAVQLWHKGFRSEPITVLEAWEAIGHDIGCNPRKDELFDSLRNMSEICRAHGFDTPSIPETSVVVERELLDGWRIERNGNRIIVQQPNNGAGYSASRNGDSGIAESVLFFLAEAILSSKGGDV